MHGKIRVGVLFGGRAGEHEAPVASAVAALDPAKDDAFPIDGAGMTRVDFCLERGTDRLILNQINPIPGVTATSVYAKLRAASRVPHPAVIDRLIGLALKRGRERVGPPA